jgi:acyl carrier protein
MVTMKDGTEAQVRQFIVDQFLFGQGGDHLRVDESLLEKGLIDSTGVLEMVGFLEQRFGIEIEDQELVPDNLDSIERIVRFIERKRAA